MSKMFVYFQAATILAKQLIACRKQKTRTFAASSKMGAIGNQQKVVFSSNILSQGSICSVARSEKLHNYCHLVIKLNPFKPEFTIVIFIHYKPQIAVAILNF